MLGALPASARAELAGSLRSIEFEPGERLASIVNPPARLLFLREGLAKMVGVSANGVERIIYVFRPGEVTGSRVLLEESAEAAYEIVAMTRVRALSIPKSEFLRNVETHPEVLVAVTRVFTRRLEHLSTRMLTAMSAEVPVRLSRLLLDFADGADRADGNGFVPLGHPLTHESMAQIIGASRPHTSTVLRDLEEAGAVLRRSDRGLLVRPDRLREIARGEPPPGTRA